MHSDGGRTPLYIPSVSVLGDHNRWAQQCNGCHRTRLSHPICEDDENEVNRSSFCRVVCRSCKAFQLVDDGCKISRPPKLNGRKDRLVPIVQRTASTRTAHEHHRASDPVNSLCYLYLQRGGRMEAATSTAGAASRVRRKAALAKQHAQNKNTFTCTAATAARTARMAGV